MSRTWIKIFCENWIEGPIRQETPLVRSVFIDLLALTGRLSNTGTISLPGGGGYTHEQLAKMLNISIKEWKYAVDRLSNHPSPEENRIMVDTSNEITILNWSKYQAEYEKRRDRNRNKQHYFVDHTENNTVKSNAVKHAVKLAALEKEGKRVEGDKKDKEKDQNLSSDRSGLPSTSGPYPEPQDQPLPDSKGEGAGSKPQVLVDAWNEICTNLPRVGVVSDKRVVKVKARLKQCPLEYWKAVFTKMNTTPFLKGENDRGWKSTFDWIINCVENADKVMAGAYDGVPRGNRSGRVRGAAEYQPGEYDFLEGGK